MTFYHTTLAGRMSWLIQFGIQPGRPTVWKNALGGRIVRPGCIYAWTEARSAILWGVKMRWDFGPAIQKVEPLIAVVTFEDDPEAWNPDQHAPLGFSTGLWKQGAVPVDHLTGARIIFPWEIRHAIASRNQAARPVETG